MTSIREKYEKEVGLKAIFKDSGGSARFNFDYILWLEKEASKLITTQTDETVKPKDL